MHIGSLIGGIVAAICLASPASAAYQRSVVITLDSIDYVTYDAATLDPGQSVVSAPNVSLSNCQRGGGLLPVSGKWHLRRDPQALDIDVESVRIEFNPTRLVLDSSTHDIVCDGRAMGWQTGVGRVFRDDFDAA